MKKLILTVLVIGSSCLTAQVKVGDNPTTINTDALLELESTNLGLLLPRVALTSSTSSSPLSGHTAGMVVYNTATSNDVSPGIYINDGSAWTRMASSNLEPWYSATSHQAATSNTEDIYHLGEHVTIGSSTSQGGKLTIVDDGTDGQGGDDIVINSYGNASPALLTYAYSGTESSPGDLPDSRNNPLSAGTISMRGRVNGQTAFLGTIKARYLGDGTTTVSDLKLSTHGNPDQLTLNSDGTTDIMPNGIEFIQGTLNIGPNSDNDVSIATASQAMHLNVNSSAATSHCYIEFHSEQNVDRSARIIREAGTDGAFRIQNWLGDGNVEIQTRGNGSVRLYTGSPSGSDGITVDTDNNIGIGTDAPRTKLDIRGGSIMMSSGSLPTRSSNFFTLVFNGSDFGNNRGETDLINGRGPYNGSTHAFRFHNYTYYGNPSNATVISSIRNTGSYSNTSDQRVKSNIESIPYGLSSVMALNPVSYDLHMNNQFEGGVLVKGDESMHTIGLLAQEVYDIVPEAAVKPEDDSNELWSISYSDLVPVLIKAIQDQQEIIESQNSEITSLRSDIENLRSESVSTAELDDLQRQLDHIRMQLAQPTVASTNQ